MRQEKEEWLRQKIEEDLEALAEEREKLLMELKELQDIDMPVEKLEDIHREIEVRRHTRLRAGIRLKALTVSAAAMVLILGMGVASTGSRLYVPKIFQQERGDEVTTKVNNSEAIASQYGNEYGEEEACREIEEKLGVISPRLVYKPEGMVLAEYEVIDDQNGAFMKYEYNGNYLYFYIRKNYTDSLFSLHVDGEVQDSIIMDSCGLEVSVYKYQDSEKNTYFEASFEYLNTYYSVSGMIDLEEFRKIMENILIKSA